MKINVEQFHNVHGISEIVQAFNKAGFTVSRVTGDPVPKRDSGILTKRSTILFQSGQKLEMRLNVNNGKIFQWRLNGMVLAVSNMLRLDTAVLEVINFVRHNELPYKARQAAAMLQKRERVVVPKMRVVTMTLEEQIEAHKDILAELDAEANEIKQHISVQESVNAEKREQLARLERQIAAENKREKTLEDQLGKAQQGIFESASGENSNPVMITPLPGTTGQKIAIEIDGEFGEPAMFRDRLQAIESARPGDLVEIRLNSNGGNNTMAAQAFCAALLKTPARTKAVIINAYSSGSIVAMSCDEIELTPFCSMMIHNASSGVGGKMGDMAGYATFKQGYFTEWYAQLYAGFLTPEELQDVAKGQDIWLKEDQIRKRLKSWVPIRRKQELAAAIQYFRPRKTGSV